MPRLHAPPGAGQVRLYLGVAVQPNLRSESRPHEMSSLEWSDQLVIDHGAMDETHRDFVARLAAVEKALDQSHDAVGQAFDDLLEHTIEHFAQEEAWMARIGFAPDNCHSFQHRHVLDVLREVKGVIGTTGDAQILRRLVTELANWFPAHAQLMDQALAETMAAVGMDSRTGEMAHPPQAQRQPITGCGSSSCG
jgi:hemerythrin-like metal-binding protein